MDAAIFPDTNVFLHYRRLTEIDWCALLKVKTVTIMIAPVVTGELEEQKNLNPSRKLRDRADASVRMLNLCLEGNWVRDGVTIEFLVTEPSLEIASTHNLNLRVADDRLLATMLSFRDQQPDVTCVLVTHDLPLTVKAKHHQIQLLRLPEDLRLPAEPDPLEQENKRLATELRRYQSREPVLDLTFADGERHANFQLPRPPDISDPEPEIGSLLAAAREKCKPAGAPKPPDPNSVAGQALVQMGGDSILKAATAFQSFAHDMFRDYNLRVARYHKNYEKYLRDSHAFKTLPTRTVKVELLLNNRGTWPAEDIHILLHFPDGFDLYDDENLPEEPKEPSMPSPEMSLLPSISLGRMPDVRLPQIPDPALPKIRKTNSYDVTFRRNKLQHKLSVRLHALYVAFKSWNSAQSFSFEYTIHAGNMIEASSGNLSVVVDKV